MSSTRSAGRLRIKSGSANSICTERSSRRVFFATVYGSPSRPARSLIHGADTHRVRSTPSRDRRRCGSMRSRSPAWLTGEYLEKPVAPDRTVQQRVPKQRMVRSLRSPPRSLALARPYQDPRSQHRPTSDQVPMRNVDCPGNSPHWGQPFAKGPHLGGAVRLHPQHRVTRSQQLQGDMAHFGERTLRCPKLLQPSGFPPSELSVASLSFAGVDVKKVWVRGDILGKPTQFPSAAESGPSMDEASISPSGKVSSGRQAAAGGCLPFSTAKCVQKTSAAAPAVTSKFFTGPLRQFASASSLGHCVSPINDPRKPSVGFCPFMGAVSRHLSAAT